MTSTGKPCEDHPCASDGWHEYCGYCAWHWVDMSEKDRQILLKQHLGFKLPDVHHHHYDQTKNTHIEHRYPRKLTTGDMIALGIGVLVSSFLYEAISRAPAVWASIKHTLYHLVRNYG